jgi:hypothetical protein
MAETPLARALEPFFERALQTVFQFDRHELA